jgi:ADP-ribosylglycohydrolase
MRVSPVGFAFPTLEEVLREARRSAQVTHNHAEGIRGAEAVSVAILLGRMKKGKDYIRQYLTEMFGYDLQRTVDKIRPAYRFDETCPGSVPESIIAFLDSTGYEDAVRKAVSLGGDADTMACISGGIAEAFYGGVPAAVASETKKRLDPRLLAVVEEFYRTKWSR